MAAKWTWHNTAFQGTDSGDGEGWFLSDGLVITRPQSIQRLIFSATATGYNVLSNINVGPSLVPGGYVELTWTVQDGDTTQVVWSGRSSVVLGSASIVDDAGHQWASVSMSEDRPLAGDFQLRRQSRPAPAPDLIVGFYWHYHPLPYQSPSTVQYPSYDYSMNVNWLTSEPASTA